METTVVKTFDRHGNGIWTASVDGTPVVQVATVYGINERALGFGVFRLDASGEYKGWTKGKYDFATALERANAIIAKAGGTSLRATTQKEN